MKILIAGGCGFIGSNLVKYFLEQNHTITVVDNLATSSTENIQSFTDNEQFKFINGDITTPEVYQQLLNEKQEVIYHLASPASPVQYTRLPLETLKANSVGTEQLLKLAQVWNARFIFASTSEIYGDPLEHPQKETYWGNVNTRGPRSCYDESKRLGETICYVYQKKFNIDIRVVRIFNTYGPHMEKEDGRVISNFVMQALTGKPITIYGSGAQTRSFSYVSDLVRALDLVAQKPVSGEVINLGNPQENSIQDIALLIKKLSNSSSEIIYKPLPIDDPHRRKPDISKAKALLGWEPTVKLEQGLLETITYFKNRFQL